MTDNPVRNRSAAYVELVVSSIFVEIRNFEKNCAELDVFPKQDSLFFGEHQSQPQGSFIRVRDQRVNSTTATITLEGINNNNTFTLLRDFQKQKPNKNTKQVFNELFEYKQNKKKTGRE